MSHTTPGVYDLVEAAGVEKDATMRCVPKSKGRNPPAIDGLPLVTPPYGRVTAPLTHMSRGKQYIVVAVGDRNIEPELVALALP